jgi:hypothetical protein
MFNVQQFSLYSIFTAFSFFQVTQEVHLLILMAMLLVLIQLHSHVKVIFFTLFNNKYFINIKN